MPPPATSQKPPQQSNKNQHNHDDLQEHQVADQGDIQQQHQVGVQLKDKVLEAYSDAGYVVLVCLKLEVLLTDVLIRYCDETSEDIAMCYIKKYGKKDMQKIFSDVKEKNYSHILTMRCRMTLGNLIFEVFQNNNPDDRRRRKENSKNKDDSLKKDGLLKNPAEKYGLQSEQKDIERLNELRVKVVHYGDCTDRTDLLNSLRADERKEISRIYNDIIRENGLTFNAAYHDNLVAVSECQWLCFGYSAHLHLAKLNGLTLLITMK